MLLSKVVKFVTATTLSVFLMVGAVQLTTQPVKAATCVCPAQMFPGCTFDFSYFPSNNFKCCVYSCGIEYCGVDGPGNC